MARINFVKAATKDHPEAGTKNVAVTKLEGKQDEAKLQAS